MFIKFLVPCFNVRNEVGRMLNSILSQTFKDFHIVCVDDCSTDGTLKLLQKYKDKFPDKITLIENPKNMGGGQARDVGYDQTLESVQSDYLWMVDADDNLANNGILQKIHEFVLQHPDLDIINLGVTFKGKYCLSRVGWPIAPWGRIIRTSVYVHSIQKNIQRGNDVYPHFVMFDNVDDVHIGQFNQLCYMCQKPGHHINGRVKSINCAKEVGLGLMSHEFRKSSVMNALKKSPAGTFEWIRKNLPEFKLKAVPRKVSIMMASFPHRKEWMLKCIGQLIGQCDNFYLWLNEYKEIPKELLKFDQTKLHVTIGSVNMKENGRYTFLSNEACGEDYCFICDDDINYPSTYVKNAIQCFQRKGDDIVVAYFINRVDKFESGNSTDVVSDISSNFAGVNHYRFGLGTCAFVPALMNFKFTHEELVSHYDIEMFIGKECHDKHIKVVSPKRPVGFVKFIRNSMDAKQIDKYALHLSGNADRTRRTYNYMSHRDAHNRKSKLTAIEKRNISEQVVRSLTKNQIYWHG